MAGDNWTDAYDVLKRAIKSGDLTAEQSLGDLAPVYGFEDSAWNTPPWVCVKS